jgi:Txe/YoeB family toxin of Txe-Axe toxin-antitoxin module
MQLESSNLKSELKKLKRYPMEQKVLDRVLKHIKICENFKALDTNPISRMYSFERLKYGLSQYYSFRLEKSGVIRLIVSIDEENNIVSIEYISVDHYDDFKRKIKKS